MIENILQTIRTHGVQKKPCIIAIDGPCGSGKTTLSEKLSKELSCPVIHMDDFFLPPSMRTEKRLSTPGGNIDHERFLQEVLQPLCQTGRCAFRPYLCQTQTMGELITIEKAPVVIVEGSYAHHPALTAYYALRIFVDVDKTVQLQRIQKRNPDKWERFQTTWIPLENAYFERYDIRKKADIQITL
ncbi:MAG: hypothetical protein E7402_01380 [Ruminococcaceae bacterium]|nr:hypothetical protein [Oscillospiraceae bacterium]